jgi:formyl-CoA transferase
MAHDLLRAMGREDLLGDPRYGTRDGRVTEPRMVESLVEEWTSQRTVDEVLDTLKHARIAIAPVRTQAEALNDPRVVARAETRPVSHPDQGDAPGIRTSGVPIVFSESQTGFAFPARKLGEDNDAIYGGLLGYDEARRAALRDGGTI